MSDIPIAEETGLRGREFMSYCEKPVMKKSKIILSIFHLEQNLIHFSLFFFGNRFPVNRNDIITYCGIWEYL